MKVTMLPLLKPALFFCLSTSVVYGGNDIKILAPWIQDAPPVARVHAAYMTLENSGSRAAIIVDTRSPAFDKAEIHKSESHKGMTGMTRQKALKIPAKSRIELKPGSYHIMLTGRKHPLKTGDQVQLTLILSDGTEITAPATVRKALDHPMHNH